MKKSITTMRMALVLVVGLGTLAIIGLILFKHDNTVFDYVLTILSIVVTLILGIVTYNQADVQNKLDMIDKTPCFFPIYYSNDEIQQKVKEEAGFVLHELILLDDTKYVIGEPLFGTKKEVLITIPIENLSEIVITNMKVEYKIAEGEYSPVRNDRLESLIENINKDSHGVVIEINDLHSGADHFCIKENDIRNLYAKANNDDVIECSFKMDMSSIQGYHYREIIHLKLKKVGVVRTGMIYLVCNNSIELQDI